MTKAVTKKQETSVALPENLQGAWGAEDVDGADILIPRLLLMQPLSESVGEDGIEAGDIIKSTTREAMKECEIIPLMTFKTWRIMELRDGKFEFKTIVPITAENANEDWEWQENGIHYRRDRVLNYYVLLPSEIARELKALKELEAGNIPDADDCLIPCLLGFTRTSTPAGKELATFFKKAQHFRIPPATQTFRLYSEFEKNDKGKYYIFKVEKARKTTMEELNVAKRWYDTLKTASDIKIDDSLDDGVASNQSDEMDEINDTF